VAKLQQAELDRSQQRPASAAVARRILLKQQEEQYKATTTTATPIIVATSKEAAREKAKAGESLAVEHTAELAPEQARRVRTDQIFYSTTDTVKRASKRRRRTKH
jgi:hypothetical protein